MPIIIESCIPEGMDATDEAGLKNRQERLILLP
jgi:hypothetical protein